jgi:outer membrane protein assembly factor BamD (BamD/ComL family)
MGINEIKGIIITLLIMILFFSCMPKSKKGLVIPQPEVITAPVIPLDVIDEKISMLREFSEKKDISPEDRENAINLLSDYSKIRSFAIEGISDKNYRELVRILFNNLSMLEERYFMNKIIAEGKVLSRVINQYYAKEQEILDSYLSGDYQGVISKCAELESSFGNNAITPDIGLLLAMSLAKRNRINEAINVGEEIVEALEGRPDLIYLRASIIEWQLDRGNREKALKLFDKLIEDFDENKAVFDSTNKMMGNHGGTFGEMDWGAFKELSSKERDIPITMQKLLDEADALVKKGALDQAKLLLLKWRLRTEKSSEIEIIEQALKYLNLEEQRYRDGISREKEAIERITKLIEQENYKEAIKGLEAIDNDQDNSLEIKRLRDIAVEKLINSERSRAAQIYLMAKSTSDNKKKKELLLSSYNILKELIDTYPSSSLLDTLKNNLSKVEGDLKKLK